MRAVTSVLVFFAGLLWSQSPLPPGARRSAAEQPSTPKWQKEIEEATSHDFFAGAVLVARNGQAVFRKAYGLADREKRLPNLPDTKFRIASMNKMFTAVAIAQLAQRGKLRFSDPVKKHVRDLADQPAGSVTVEQLLTHTAGTGDIFGPEFNLHRSELKRLSDYVVLFGRRPLMFPPGSKFRYSNYGFILLGLIVERVSGQSYYDYIREQIFDSAGMKSTDSPPEDKTPPDIAVGYTRTGGGALRRNTDTLPPRGTSAGGGYSTVDDLLRFGEALLNHRLLDRFYTDQVTQGRVVAAAGPGIRYGYGFFVKESNNRNPSAASWFGHGGGAPGMNGELRIYPRSGYVVAILANSDPSMAAQIAVHIGETLPAR
jgi:CubicO group peptidase (beta-lactamase class C family)